MKKRTLVGMIAVSSISLVLILLYQFINSKLPLETPQTNLSQKKQADIVIPMISQTEIDATIKTQRTERDKQETYVKKIEQDKDFAKSELQRLIAENPQAKKIYRLVQATTFPIEFHGKIIDKSNNPIPDVEIKYSIGQAYSLGQPIHHVTKSDINGRYIIKGEGATVSINHLIKAGYQFPESRQHFYTVVESGRPNTWRDYVANNPYVTFGRVLPLP